MKPLLVFNHRVILVSTCKRLVNNTIVGLAAGRVNFFHSLNQRRVPEWLAGHRFFLPCFEK